jgi:arylsulfatase
VKTIFISLDTLRADRLTALGYGRGLTPNLDRIAGEGALFTQTYASDIPTQPSHTALFTGRFGVSTGIVSHFFPPASLAHEVEWLPTMMRDAGNKTGAVDHLFAMKDWFIRGYDDYMPPPGRSRSPGEVVNDMAFPWIAERVDEDFFLFLHFWDAHIPYQPPQPFKDRYTAESRSWVDPDVLDKLKSRPSFPLFQENNYQYLGEIPNVDYIADLYDAEIAYLDDQIGRLVAYLASLGILDDTMLVIFGDHGEVMAEHDAWFDHAGLYDSVTHVPLIIRYPPAVPAGRHDGFVQLVDVFPTALEIVGLDVPEGIDGISLMPVIRGESAGARDRVFLSECTWEAARGIRTTEWKLIRHVKDGVYVNPEYELFHLPSDPDEQTNVALLHPEVVTSLAGEMDDWLAAHLAGRPDAMQEVVDAHLPAVARLNLLVAEQALDAVTADQTTAEPATIVVDEERRRAHA